MTSPRVDDLEQTVARLLTVGTYGSIALLAAGVAALAAAGQSPLDAAPAFDPARVVADVAALRPDGLLWLGVVLIVATPSARVAASLVGYLKQRDVAMAVVSLLILAVIALSVGVAVASGG